CQDRSAVGSEREREDPGLAVQGGTDGPSVDRIPEESRTTRVAGNGRFSVRREGQRRSLAREHDLGIESLDLAHPIANIRPNVALQLDLGTRAEPKCPR